MISLMSRYHDNITFVKQELLPKIEVERDKAVDAFKDKWRDRFKLTGP
jgi:hypothetical protein